MSVIDLALLAADGVLLAIIVVSALLDYLSR